MTNPLTLALGEDALSDLQAELDDLRAELQAHRDGIGHLAEDPMHAGQPVHLIYDAADEPVYRLQVTHAGIPLWQCSYCHKLTVTADPSACVGCGRNAIDAFEPLLYPTPVRCRTVEAAGVSPYEEPCLIAGSDGCEC